jgi:RHS repeat-associated protein
MPRSLGSDGLRRTSNVNGTIRKYMLDNGMMVRETDANGASQATYLAGLRGPEYRRDDVNGSIKWYVGACPEERRDGLGSVLAEVDHYGALTASRKLDVYGAPRATQGTSSSKHAFVGNLGHTTEPDTGGLVYMRARWMDPVTGRFLSEDPAFQGRNWFQYCFSNPVNGLDQDGRRA